MYKKLVEKNDPDPTNKTNADDEELVRLIPTAPLSWEKGLPLHDEQGSLHELSSPGRAQVQAHRRYLSDVPVARIWEQAQALNLNAWR